MQANASPTSRAHCDGAQIHYERHRPEQTTLQRLVQQHAQSFFAQTEETLGAGLPQFVKDEFDAFLECGILAHGFLRLRCADCGHDKLLAFSCKRRGFCPSCGARRMSQSAAHLVEHVIPRVPVPSGSLTRHLSHWDGAATWRCSPDQDAVLQADPLFGHLVVHRPDSPRYLCLEPVSHVANGFNLADSGVAGTGTRMLAPGESMGCRVRIALLHDARAALTPP